VTLKRAFTQPDTCLLSAELSDQEPNPTPSLLIVGRRREI